jgi:hypothetical protein
MKDPDFYLASTDYYNVKLPRRVWRLKRMSGGGRDDLLLARIALPIIEQKHGPDTESIEIVLLAQGTWALRYSLSLSGLYVFTCFVPRSTIWKNAMAYGRTNCGILPGPNSTKPKKTHIRNRLEGPK